MNQRSIDHSSVIYDAISRTFPKIRKWNNSEKNHLFELIKKYLFENKILLLEELTQLTNTATSIIISGYQISVEKNNLKTLEELEKYLIQLQQIQLQDLFTKMNHPDKSAIQKLKKELPTRCKMIKLEKFRGGRLEEFEKWMSHIFYKEKRC